MKPRKRTGLLEVRETGEERPLGAGGTVPGTIRWRRLKSGANSPRVEGFVWVYGSRGARPFKSPPVFGDSAAGPRADPP